MNDYLMEIMLRERKKEMLAEAERRRLLRIYARHRAEWRRNLLALLGRCLVVCGEKLIRRYGGNAAFSPHSLKQGECSH